jgi:hypothetical protein
VQYRVQKRGKLGLVALLAEYLLKGEIVQRVQPYGYFVFHNQSVAQAVTIGKPHFNEQCGAKAACVLWKSLGDNPCLTMLDADRRKQNGRGVALFTALEV